MPPLPRPPPGLRPVAIETGFSRYAEGSALMAAGRTRVLCVASLEDRVPDFLRGRGQGWLTAEYGMLPRATHTRSPRERAGSKPNGRALEISRLIGRVLRQAVDLRALGERTLTLDCDVLDADGGTRCAAITGGMVALALALRKAPPRPPAADGGEAAPLSPARFISAVSVGYVDGRPALDLDYDRDHRAEVDMNVAMDDGGRYVELQGSAETRPFSDRQLSVLRRLAAGACAWLCQAQRRAVDEASGLSKPPCPLPAGQARGRRGRGAEAP